MIYDVNDDEDDDDDNATMHLPCTCHALCMYTGSMAPIAHDTRLRNRFRTFSSRVKTSTGFQLSVPTSIVPGIVLWGGI